MPANKTPPREVVPFEELRQLNDSESFVWTGLTFNPKEQPAIEEWLREVGFLPADAVGILSMHRVGGNVLGDQGRTDVLFVTTATQFNPIARLKIDGLKWTSDFIANYGADYGQLAVVDDEDEEEQS